MKTGIVGLKQVGKTTIFNILTGAGADTGPGSRKDIHMGVTHVPDERLDQIACLFAPRKKIEAVAHYVDMPGVEPEEMKESAFLTNLRQVDALAHVIRTFKNDAVPHPAGGSDPGRDIENMELEMIFADIFQTERRLERLEKDLQKIKSKDLLAEQEVLQRVHAHLEKEHPLRELELSPDEKRQIRGFTFLSQKPILHIINMDEDALEQMGDVTAYFQLEEWDGRPGVVVAGVCGKIEEELTQLTHEEVGEFMQDLGISESGMIRLVRENYRLLGLISFFTIGKDEVRAWTIPKGSTAQAAAGAVHSDMERGFIRAEVARHDDLTTHGSLHALRDRGLLRLEGKDYVLQDGEIMLVRFNV